MEHNFRTLRSRKRVRECSVWPDFPIGSLRPFRHYAGCRMPVRTCSRWWFWPAHGFVLRGRFSIQPPSQRAVYVYLPIRDLSLLWAALSTSGTVSLLSVFFGLPGQFCSVVNLHFPRCVRVLACVSHLRLSSHSEGVQVHCGPLSIIHLDVLRYYFVSATVRLYFMLVTSFNSRVSFILGLYRSYVWCDRFRSANMLIFY